MVQDLVLPLANPCFLYVFKNKFSSSDRTMGCMEGREGGTGGGEGSSGTPLSTLSGSVTVEC